MNATDPLPDTDPASTNAASPNPVASANRFVDDLSNSLAPMPSEQTIRRRTNLVIQSARFLTVNLKMYRMARRSHNWSAVPSLVT